MAFMAVCNAGPLAAAGKTSIYNSLQDTRPGDPVGSDPLHDLPLAVQQKIRTQMVAIQYAVLGANTDDSVPYQADNAAMGYQVQFEPEQVQFKNTRSKAEAWALSMQLAAYGYEGSPQSVQPARICPDQNRISYTRGTVEEWYVNTPEGVEQGFTLTEPPGRQGSAPLQFKIAVGGGLQPRMAPDGKNIDLYDIGGNRVLTYRKLKVTDARGSVLPASMKALAAHDNGTDPAIVIAVNDASAVYPIVVDPILSAPKLLAEDGADGDLFGAAVSISGDTVAVGAWGNDEQASNAGAVYIFERNHGGTDAWGQAAKLTAADGAVDDLLGYSVSISGDTVAVGAPLDDDRGDYAGSVYIFERDGLVDDRDNIDNWSQVVKLTAADGADYQRFGYSISLSGDILVVGAPWDDDRGTASGSVYIFERDGLVDDGDKIDNWSQVVKRTADGGAEFDLFGFSVSISGDTVAVGAPADSPNLGHGAAYIFERDHGGRDAWEQAAELVPLDGADGTCFGFDISISGDTAAVGAYRDDDKGPIAGAAYLFERDWLVNDRDGIDHWSQAAKLTAADGMEHDFFGYTISIDQDTVVVGAAWEDDIGDNSGSAYLFERDGRVGDRDGMDNWSQVAKLTSADTAAKDIFGYSVSISEGTVAIGVPYDDVKGSNSGSVYIQDGVPGVSINPVSGLNTTELGGSATFTVVLDTNPYADVIIDLTCSDDSECSVSPTTLRFSDANWNSAQTVTVTGVDDAVEDGDVAFQIITSAIQSKGLYHGLDPADVSLTNMDDDSVGILVNPTSGLTTTETGGIAMFTVALATQPLGDVFIDLSSSDADEGTVSPDALTFTSDNWDQMQIVTVTGVDDAVADGDTAYQIITAAAQSRYAPYDGLNPADVSLINMDDEAPGVTVSPTSGLTTNESGTSATFTVVLNTPPLADVTIDLISSDANEGTASPASLTFTVSDWDVEQTVTVTGEDDSLTDGDKFYVITTSVCASSDPVYNGIDPANVALTNVDDGATGSESDDDSEFSGGSSGGGGGSGCFISAL